MQATPATWKLLVAAGWEGSERLKVLCGGEPLPRTLADTLLERVDQLWNMYGPTETTVWSTVDRIERDAPIRVGTPIANTTVYILGDDLELRPIGVAGELYIGGAGVANGYVNRPDLTAERFIDSPFRPGERLYRTGDLARFCHDGSIEHLGRLDNQVKIRGFRIELGEVESALQSHPAVSDAVAVAADDRLIAYVVFNPDGHATTTELRNWVSATLPPYMVPAMVATLDALPLTPNGKVDRKALPTVGGYDPGPADLVEPTDPIGREIAAVWRSLLEVERVGVGDNFFEIGGHSLLAMEAVAMIEERTGHRPEPRSLFFMTLGEIAAAVSSPTVPA
jgi:acyl-coenzyme A synthetase/AMP-(fatty) acid ligase